MMLGNMYSTFPALFFILLAVFQEPALAIKKSYVVYLGGQSGGGGLTTDADLAQVTQSHTALLSSLLGSKGKAQESLVYSYRRNINGFSALLSDEEAAEMRKNPGVVSVFEDKAKRLHTSHSWEFMRLEKNGVIHSSSLWERAKFGEDVIIANLDTGVWPESKSLDDKDFGPIPSNWKGSCQFKFKGNKTRSFCNKKLIGARYFNEGFVANTLFKLNSTYYTPRDTEGHGTHTLSTAAGNFVPGANVFGSANGTIKGGSPRARAASYKVCWPPINNGGECYDSDILKGFETAIDDGVHVLSVSLGGDGSAPDYQNDAIAIGSFHAVKKGITVVASAGNNGDDGTVTNTAPWIITVAASTIDRDFEANVKLGNGKVFKGAGISKPLPANKLYPLITGVQAKAANASAGDAKLCMLNSLDREKAKGKIVVCLRGVNGRVLKGVEVGRAGGVGLVLPNDIYNGADTTADPHIVPASNIGYKDGLALYSYIDNTKNPEAWISPTTVVLNAKPSPRLAAFSSRGPNDRTPEINKPDITAPGVNIIASFSGSASPSESDLDKRRTPYLELSGTSMSCPHVAGVVGLLKSLHPDWSPAAIRSAIMTTARTRDNTRHPASESNGLKVTPLGYGAGHIRPNHAADPGLVYDITENDYLNFLCGINYTEESIRLFSGSKHTCPTSYSILNFNNPAITVPYFKETVTVKRTLKNLGKPGKYKARLRSPPGYVASVEPESLNFEKTGEEKVFTVTIKAVRSSRAFKYGSLRWTDGSHYVRTPILVSAAKRRPGRIAGLSYHRTRPPMHA